MCVVFVVLVVDTFSHIFSQVHLQRKKFNIFLVLPKLTVRFYIPIPITTGNFLANVIE